MGGEDRLRGPSVAFVLPEGETAQKLGPLKAYCECCVSRGRGREASTSGLRRVSFLTACDPDELVDEDGSDPRAPDSAAYAAVRKMSKRISVVEQEIEIDEEATAMVSGADIDSFEASVPGLDASLAKVVRIAETMLPGRALSPWQLGWCTAANVKIYADARAGDAEKAGEILALALAWRGENQEMLSRSRVPRWTGDGRVLVRSQDGHPLIYFCFRHQVRFPHWKDTVDHWAAAVEAAVEGMRGNATTFDFVFDCHGFRISNNLDPRPTVGCMQVLKHPYRGRVRHGFIVDAPRAFGWVWNVAVPHMPPDTRNKIKFASSSDIAERLAACAGPEVSQAVHDVMASNRSDDPASSWRQPSELID